MVRYDSRDGFYKTPFGAVPAGVAVWFRITTPPDLYVNQAMLVYDVNGSEQILPLLYETTTQVYNSFTLEFTPEETGTAFYHFLLHTERGAKQIRSFAHGQGFLTDDPNAGGRFQLTVYDREFTAPAGWQGGVIYQIFPDRFFSSGKEHPNVPADRILRSDWGGLPQFLPDENGQVRNNDYFGGDLAGITEKLPYLKELGVTAVYYNPIFEAHSNHRYNTADYRKIDPLLGDEADFISLCGEAHRQGIRIILDGVFSHTGSDSVYFNANSRYPSPGAANSVNSPYYKWYDFKHWPDTYASWWGIKTLPAVNELEPSYLNFICGEGGVIDKWLSLGADGFRLDVADELPDEFIASVRKAVRRNGEDKLLIGEVWEDASNKVSYGVLRKYLLGNELDSVMNYPFKDAVLEFVRRGNCENFRDAVLAVCEHYPPAALHTAMNSLSTHDTPRAITALAGESGAGKDRLWQAAKALTPAEYALGIKRLKLAMALQFVLPGIPCIYYGDEAGAQGYTDPFNRGCFPWGHENAELTAFVKLFGKLRRENPVLAKGSLRFLDSPDGTVGLLRTDGENRFAVFVNPLMSPVTVPVPQALYGCKPVIGNAENGTLRLEPYGLAVFA